MLRMPTALRVLLRPTARAVAARESCEALRPTASLAQPARRRPGVQFLCAGVGFLNRWVFKSPGFCEFSALAIEQLRLMGFQRTMEAEFGL